MPVRDRAGLQLTRRVPSNASPPVEPPDEVDRLTGIGPKLKNVMAEHGVGTVAHLLLHIPRRYEDRTQIVPPTEPPFTSCCAWTETARSGSRARSRAVRIDRTRERDVAYDGVGFKCN